MIAKNLADELGPRGIRVNGLLPGRVETDRVRWLDEQSGDAAAAKEKASQGISLRRYGEPRRSSDGWPRSCCHRLRASSPA